MGFWACAELLGNVCTGPIWAVGSFWDSFLFYFSCSCCVCMFSIWQVG